MSICTCSTHIASIPNASCPKDFGQIQKIIFQRIIADATEEAWRTKYNWISNEITLASITTSFSATDNIKMVITPFLEAPTSDGGEAITFGGGNETPNGILKTLGRTPTDMSFQIRRCDQSVIKALKQLVCEEIGVYLLNGDNQILGIKKWEDEGEEWAYLPIPIKSLFVGDLKLGGLDNPDANLLSFSFMPNWSDEVDFFTASFNPVEDLQNA